MKCSRCDAKLPEGTRFCSYCGSKVEPDVHVPTEEIPVVITNEETLEFEMDEVPKMEHDKVSERESNPLSDIDEISENTSLAVGIKRKFKVFWNKLSLFGKMTTIALTAFTLMCLVSFLAGKTFAGVIAIVQITLVVIAVLMQKGIIKVPKSRFFIATFALSILLIVPYISLLKVEYSEAEKFEWSDIVLNDIVPEPESHLGEIFINSGNYLSLYVYKTNQTQYNEYVDECIEKGFIIDVEQMKYSFYAYDESGYKLSLYYFEKDKKMHIGIDSPEKYGTLAWPESGLAMLIPTPNSSVGEITQDDEKGFYTYVGETSIEDYKKYVKMCSDVGFNVDVSDSDKYYFAQNSDGYRLSVNYHGNNVITISLYEPEYNIDIEVECVENLIFSKYDVDIYVDDVFIGTLNHGNTNKYYKILPKGIYTIKFMGADDEEITGEVDVMISKDENIKLKISCSSLSIDVEVISGTTPETELKLSESEESISTKESFSEESTEVTPDPFIEPEVIQITMIADSSFYEGKTYSEVEREFKDLGFKNINFKANTTSDSSIIDGAVISITVDSNSFKSGDSFDADTNIEIVYWKYEMPISEYELAFVRELNSYSLYYMFDTDNNTVVYFGTDDTYLEKGIYTGNFSTGITISWEHGEWTEKFTYKEGSSKATLIDGSGWDWEYKVCDLKKAQDVLDTRQ